MPLPRNPLGMLPPILMQPTFSDHFRPGAITQINFRVHDRADPPKEQPQFNLGESVKLQNLATRAWVNTGLDHLLTGLPFQPHAEEGVWL
jgi:hypothetical protein